MENLMEELREAIGTYVGEWFTICQQVWHDGALVVVFYF